MEAFTLHAEPNWTEPDRAWLMFVFARQPKTDSAAQYVQLPGVEVRVHPETTLSSK
jgi:hypothetical protein